MGSEKNFYFPNKPSTFSSKHDHLCCFFITFNRKTRQWSFRSCTFSPGTFLRCLQESFPLELFQVCTVYQACRFNKKRQFKWVWNVLILMLHAWVVFQRFHTKRQNFSFYSTCTTISNYQAWSFLFKDRQDIKGQRFIKKQFNRYHLERSWSLWLDGRTISYYFRISRKRRPSFISLSNEKYWKKICTT